jgi:hypothetical protein
MIKAITLISLLMLSMGNYAHAQKQGMMPLNDAVKGINLSKPDNSSIGFIGSRCGTLYMAIAGYFAANANKDSERKAATDFMARAEIFSFVGIYVDSTLNKKTNDAIKAQGEALSKAYIDEMLAGKRLNNNVFTKLIESDVNFCVDQLPQYSALYNTIQNSAKK